MKTELSSKRNGQAKSHLGDVDSSQLAASRISADEQQPRAHRRLEWAVNHAAFRIAEHMLNWRVALLASGHAVLFTLIYWTAFGLRFDFSLPASHAVIFWRSLPYVLGIKFLVFYLMGHYHGWWRYVTFSDLIALLRASVMSLLILAAVDHFFLPFQISRTVLLLDALLAIVVIGALRSGWRFVREGGLPRIGTSGRVRALLVGVDDATVRLAITIHTDPRLPFQIAGFLTTDRAIKKGTRFGQIPVLGNIQDVRTIASAARTEIVLVTAGTITGTALRDLMEHCSESDLVLKIVPPVGELLNGNDRVPIRDIDISDLLQRDPVQLDTESIGRLLTGRAVMVTGAGGSIGSEICRQLIKFRPSSLILVGRGENRIFFLERDLRDRDDAGVLHTAIADITDEARMRQVFEQFHPEIVFHAAAHKHVPLMEQNVGEAIKNNVLGTKCVADLADEFGVKRFVMISTDKAVNPSSIMGVSKHIAERYVYTMSQESETRFMVTRFGNVLGSSGSVVPIFQEQIRRGGPITVTHPDMTRFFMTIPEASQLVLQASAMGRGGEIFVLEMGRPVRIVDLAHDLVRLSGLPADAIDIVFSGIRPGEKLHEELYFETERMLETSHPKLHVAYHRPFSSDEVRRDIAVLEDLRHGPEGLIRRKLHEMVPEYIDAQTKVSRSGEVAPPRTVQALEPSATVPMQHSNVQPIK